MQYNFQTDAVIPHVALFRALPKTLTLYNNANTNKITNTKKITNTNRSTNNDTNTNKR